MKRIFIAVKVQADETLLNILSIFKERLTSEKVKWTRVDNMHITLVFLGNKSGNQIKIIRAILNEICEGFGKFEFIIQGTGVFKNFRDPRVILADVVASEKLSLLNSLILKELKKYNIIDSDMPFKPHLTLGRIKYLNSGQQLQKLIEEYSKTIIQKVKVSEIILYESILLHTGPVYRVINRYIL